MENVDDNDFDECIVSGISCAKTILEMWGTDNELSLVLADSLLIANSGDLELRKTVLSGGGLIWS